MARYLTQEPRTSFSVLSLLIVVKAALLFSTIGRYGIFRDELYYIACSDHLDWGYVDHPPFSIALLRLARAVLGNELWAIRFLAVVAGLLLLWVVVRITVRLGGGTLAQLIAGMATLFSPVFLASGRFYSMNAFDHLFWAVSFLLLIRLVQEQRERDWILLGLVVGLGLLNKYSMGFWAAAVGLGLLMTGQRRLLTGKLPWFAALLASFIFLPHLLWQISLGWPSLEFMHNASHLKNAPLTATTFVFGQFLENGPANSVVWVAGLAGLLFYRKLTAFRLFAIAYLLLLVFFIFSNAKVYYLAPCYSLLFAAGGVWWASLLNRLRFVLPSWLLILHLVVGGAVVMPLAVPVLSVNTLIAYQEWLGVAPPAGERNELGALPQHYADMFGWQEFALIFADAFSQLTPEEQGDCVIYVRNYGQAGAIDYYGPALGLPPASCGHNNYWYWGPPEESGSVAIILGRSHDLEESRRDLEQHFDSVELVGTTENPHAMPYETGRHVFICKGMKSSFQEIWPDQRHFI